MTIQLICVGKLKERYLTDACGEYCKRLGSFCRLSVLEIEEERLPDNPSDAQIQAGLSMEGRRILDKAWQTALSVALCIEGKMLSSTQLAEKLQEFTVNGKSSVSFIIGGSYGLSPEVKKHCALQLSMSPMTFPHQLARVMLLEQIYRAFQINGNGKYHK